MKRTLLLLRWWACAGAMILTVSLFLFAGCSGSGYEGSGEGGKVAASYGLDRSEFIAIKKANKNHHDFKQALRKQKLEKLKKESMPEGAL
jgi:hypothetical protein